MAKQYYPVVYPDNPLEKLWDDEAVMMILHYLQSRPYLRLQVIKELMDCEYDQSIAEREKKHTPNYGIADKEGSEEIIVRVKACAAKS